MREKFERWGDRYREEEAVRVKEDDRYREREREGETIVERVACI